MKLLNGATPSREQIVWETRRLARAARRFLGWEGVVALVALLLAAAAFAWWDHEYGKLQRLRALPVEPDATTVATADDDRSRLRAFDAYLPRHDDIPDVVKDLMQLAETEHLTLVRGEYRPRIEPQSGFVRYGMTLPVRGDAQSVYRFMLAALKAHRTLALETVQFKRGRISSSEVEARIQWVLITGLPGSTAAEPMTLPVASARNGDR